MKKPSLSFPLFTQMRREPITQRYLRHPMGSRLICVNSGNDSVGVDGFLYCVNDGDKVAT